tara:strand:- start:271 stop:471 length:201 start_codon:yes stop_codon:yes gene_type:complete
MESGSKGLLGKLEKLIHMAMGKKKKKGKKEVKFQKSKKLILSGVFTALGSIALLIYIVSVKILHLK